LFIAEQGVIIPYFFVFLIKIIRHNNVILFWGVKFLDEKYFHLQRLGFTDAALISPRRLADGIWQ